MMTQQERTMFRRRVHEARRLGRDLLEYLDYWNHLFTFKMFHDTRADALFNAAQKIENLPVLDIIRKYRKGDVNALGAQAAIVEMIRDLARQEVDDGPYRPGGPVQ